jgi:serine/threonine protein kinase
MMATISATVLRFEELELPQGTEVVSGNDIYLIQEQIGRGGFGVIYRATLAGTDYALKVAAGDLAQQRLLREAEITSILSRMNLGVFPLRILRDATIALPSSPLSRDRPKDTDGENVSAHALRDTLRRLDHRHCAVGVIRDMSHFGTVLADFLPRENDLSDAIGMMLTILRVLRPIHETSGLQYLHGDISPENIIYVPDVDVAVFIDFGSAQQLGEDGRALVAREEFSYNPVYMSPEARAFLASSHETASLSKASDIYSLGLIFYGLLFEAPDEASSEHVAVLVRNRVNSRKRAGTWSTVVCRLMMRLFEDCLVTSEDSRLQDVDALSSRLAEIRDLLDDRDISKASMRLRLLERGILHTADSRFPVDIEDEGGHSVDLCAVLSDPAARLPILLSGARGSGKTTLLRTTALWLLEAGGLVPVVIDAGELRGISRMTDMLRALAVAVYHNVFGHGDPPKPHVITKLVAVLGLRATEGVGFAAPAATGGGAAPDADGGASGADFVLFIDNVDLLESSPRLLAQLAGIVDSTTQTRFVLCENAPPPTHTQNPPPHFFAITTTVSSSTGRTPGRPCTRLGSGRFLCRMSSSPFSRTLESNAPRTRQRRSARPPCSPCSTRVLRTRTATASPRPRLGLRYSTLHSSASTAMARTSALRMCRALPIPISRQSARRPLPSPTTGSSRVGSSARESFAQLQTGRATICFARRLWGISLPPSLSRRSYAGQRTQVTSRR